EVSPRALAEIPTRESGVVSPRESGVVSPRESGVLSPRDSGISSPRGPGAPAAWPVAPASDPWADSTPDPWAASAPIETPAAGVNLNRNAAETGPWAASEPEPAAAEPVWEADAPVGKARPTGRRISLRTKFLAAAVLPTVLAVAAAVLAIFLTVPGALRTLLLESARNPASAMADGISAFVTANQITPKDAQQLQAQLDATRLDYQAKNVAFLLVTDAFGNPLAGWYKNEPKLASMPSDIGTYVQTQARRAVAQEFMKANNFPAGTVNPPSRLVDAGGQSLEVAAQPISRAGTALGTVIVGMTSQTVQNRVLSTITGTLLASVLPILLAFLLAAWLSRNITQGIVALVRSADRISLGDMEAPIEVHANDELRELGEALERMRTSLRESMERLRRRRH
ncbi:MAG TPA: HAMP domain-containing protein, partial [Deinococcales bacterium]|nr:HAMP domain-containing protein [Deinococcales bacterium]